MQETKETTMIANALARFDTLPQDVARTVAQRVADGADPFPGTDVAYIEARTAAMSEAGRKYVAATMGERVAAFEGAGGEPDETPGDPSDDPDVAEFGG